VNQDEQDTARRIHALYPRHPHPTTAASPKTSLDDTQLAPHGYVLLLPRLREAADLDPLTEEDAVGRPAKVEHAAV
jgi:hypothetical protein